MGASMSDLAAADAAFVAKLDECQPHIDGAFVFAHVHGQTYTGPNYGEELKALKSALAADSLARGEKDNSTGAGGSANGGVVSASGPSSDTPAPTTGEPVAFACIHRDSGVILGFHRPNEKPRWKKRVTVRPLVYGDEARPGAAEKARGDPNA